MANEKTPIEILFSDESLSTLSEDFKGKATVIFENAVAAKVAEEKEKMEKEKEEEVEAAKKETEKAMEEKVDSYLTYVAEEWMKENELAVENGIQTEIAENFLKGIKDLFLESYVEIPKNKVNVVAEMTQELQKKAKALDESIDKNIALKQEIVNMKKASIVAEVAGSLADTQMAKLNDLIEMVDFENEDQFTGRVKSIVETYFKPLNESDDKDADDKKENPFAKKEEGDDEDDDKDAEKDGKEEKTDESMKRYVDAISRSIRL